MKLKKFAAAVSAALMLAVFTAAPALAADEIEVNEDISVSGDYDWTRFANDHITLNVYNNGLYISDGSDDSVNVVSAFEDLTGIKVNYTTYDSNESLYAKLKSGGVSYDVIFPSDYMVGKMAKEGMLAELNMDNIPNFVGIGEEYLDRDDIRFVVHKSHNKEEMKEMGVLPSGGILKVNRIAAEADLLISEGFIEPHFFAGFSGGRKSILPGVSSAETVMANL